MCLASRGWRACPRRGRAVDIVPSDRFGSALLYATGNAPHLDERLEALARSEGLTLSGNGIAHGKDPRIEGWRGAKGGAGNFAANGFQF
jgi:hypothetical protein